jgi:hypothetical protein
MLSALDFAPSAQLHGGRNGGCDKVLWTDEHSLRRSRRRLREGGVSLPVLSQGPFRSRFFSLWPVELRVLPLPDENVIVLL